MFARFQAAALVLTALTGLAIGASPAGATSTVTDVIILPCWWTTPAYSHLDVPQGWLAVTVEGACDYGTQFTPHTITSVSTPCSVGSIQNVPCVVNQPVTEPLAACSISVQVAVSSCSSTTPVVALSCGSQVVKVEGACVQGYGGVWHAGNGPVSAIYPDCGTCYWDNLGYFTVTLQWTPL